MFGDPTFWVLVAFVIFVLAISRPLGRGLSAALDKRAGQIKNDLDEAERMRVEAQDLLASYQCRQRDAVQEAENIVNQAREEADRLRARAAKELEHAVKRREQQALDRIAQAEAQATADVRTLAVEVALDATRRLLEENLGAEKADAMVDEAISDLPAKIH